MRGGRPGLGWLRRLQRLLRYRLVLPMLRTRHGPRYTARGVAVGMLVALTPTVGVQMPIVLALWLLVRSLYPRWDFNPLVGAAWTWVTNVLTVPPVYYVFYLTGRAMLGHYQSDFGYARFVADLHASLTGDVGWFEALWVYTSELFRRFGLPMFVGSVPWALAGAWISYAWSLRFMERRQRQREARRSRAQAGR